MKLYYYILLLYNIQYINEITQKYVTTRCFSNSLLVTELQSGRHTKLFDIIESDADIRDSHLPDNVTGLRFVTEEQKFITEEHTTKSLQPSTARVHRN